MTTRRCLGSWTVENVCVACVIRDQNEQGRACLYYDEERNCEVYETTHARRGEKNYRQHIAQERARIAAVR